MFCVIEAVNRWLFLMVSAFVPSSIKVISDEKTLNNTINIDNKQIQIDINSMLAFCCCLMRQRNVSRYDEKCLSRQKNIRSFSREIVLDKIFSFEKKAFF